MRCPVHSRLNRAVSKHFMPRIDTRSGPAAGGDLASSQHLSPATFLWSDCCASGEYGGIEYGGLPVRGAAFIG